MILEKLRRWPGLSIRVCYRPGRGGELKKVNSENYLFVADLTFLKYLISKFQSGNPALPLRRAVHGDAFGENCGTVFWRQERNRQTPARGNQYDLEVTGVMKTCRFSTLASGIARVIQHP